MRYEVLAGIKGEHPEDLPISTRNLMVEAQDELTAAFNAGKVFSCYWGFSEPVEVLAIRSEEEAHREANG